MINLESILGGISAVSIDFPTSGLIDLGKKVKNLFSKKN